MLPIDHIPSFPLLEAMMARLGLRGWVKILRNSSSSLGQDREKLVGHDCENGWVKIVRNDTPDTG
jgi:hypothetical protein